MQSEVLQNALVEHSAILLTCIKLPYGFNTFILSIFGWPLKTGFTVYFLFLIENTFCCACWKWITSNWTPRCTWIYGPRRDKTCDMILSKKRVTRKLISLCRLVCAFVVRKPRRQVFSHCGPYGKCLLIISERARAKKERRQEEAMLAS